MDQCSVVVEELEIDIVFLILEDQTVKSLVSSIAEQLYD